MLFSTRESRSSSRDCSACVRRAWPSSFSRMSTSSVNRGSPPASAFSRAMRSRKFIPASSHHCTFGCRHEASTRAANSDFAWKNGIKWAALVYVGFSSMVRRCGHCGRAFVEWPGGEPAGGPSRDGKFLSYVDPATRNLAIRDLATGQSRTLTQQKVASTLISRPSPGMRAGSLTPGSMPKVFMSSASSEPMAQIRKRSFATRRLGLSSHVGGHRTTATF